MSLTQLKETTGWTPVVDALVQRHGLITAAVFGVVWRFCKMRDGVCKANLQRLAATLGLSRRTVIRHLDILVREGYLRDLTPGRRYAPHVYVDTGRAAYIQFALEEEDEAQLPGSEELGETEGFEAQAGPPALSGPGSLSILMGTVPGFGDPKSGFDPERDQSEAGGSNEAGQPAERRQADGGSRASAPDRGRTESPGGRIEGCLGVTESPACWAESPTGGTESPAPVDKSGGPLEMEKRGVPESQLSMPESPTGCDRESRAGGTESPLNKTLLRDSLRDLVKKRGLAAEIWLEIVAKLAGEISERDLGSWILPAEPVKWDGKTLTVRARSHFAKKWLKENLEERLLTILRGIDGDPEAGLVLV